jgi:hypothetical protein
MLPLEGATLMFWYSVKLEDNTFTFIFARSGMMMLAAALDTSGEPDFKSEVVPGEVIFSSVP